MHFCKAGLAVLAYGTAMVAADNVANLNKVTADINQLSTDINAITGIPTSLQVATILDDLAVTTLDIGTLATGLLTDSTNLQGVVNGIPAFCKSLGNLVDSAVAAVKKVTGILGTIFVAALQVALGLLSGALNSLINSLTTLKNNIPTITGIDEAIQCLTNAITAITAAINSLGNPTKVRSAGATIPFYARAPIAAF